MNTRVFWLGTVARRGKGKTTLPGCYGRGSCHPHQLPVIPQLNAWDHLYNTNFGYPLTMWPIARAVCTILRSLQWLYESKSHNTKQCFCHPNPTTSILPPKSHNIAFASYIPPLTNICYTLSSKIQSQGMPMDPPLAYSPYFIFTHKTPNSIPSEYQWIH